MKSSQALERLQSVLSGKEADLKVPAHPDLSKLKLLDGYFYEGTKPQIIFSMQYHAQGELTKWFTPRGWDDFIPIVGATRFDVQQTPIFEAYNKYPDTHRVYDDGWCGHIIRDKYSAGGKDRVVLSLESPNTRAAIVKSINEFYAPRILARKDRPPLFLNMGFEYSYENYDAYSGKMFQEWLGEKYNKIEAQNKIWKTEFKSFAEVTMPSYDPTKPETNPAKYYDWGEFNLYRFTDFIKWGKGELQKVFPGVPCTTGGGNPFGSTFWKQGIDEEGLLNAEANDIILSETGSRALGTTSLMDLQRSLAGKPTLVLDPEYHATASTCFLMFLHGCGIMDYWWWPENTNEFYESSMQHSHLISLLDVETVMKAALDIRRLTKYIVPFSEQKNEIALLYSRASIVQKFPETKGVKTPYSLEMEKSYEAAVRLDAAVGFISSKQVKEGIPESLKLLLLPSVRFMEEEVFEHILAWTIKGGQAVITPSSLVADEYGRKRDYLEALGLEVLAEERPEFQAGENKSGLLQTGEFSFIQGPVVKTIVSKEPKIEFTSEKSDLFPQPVKFTGAGLIQTIKASGEWQVLGKDAEGRPMLLARKLGRGIIYYAAVQLD
ncbi:MAG: beta-galactosidase, partial [Candidatus Firestonebacteria bacterium]